MTEEKQKFIKKLVEKYATSEDVVDPIKAYFITAAVSLTLDENKLVEILESSDDFNVWSSKLIAVSNGIDDISDINSSKDILFVTSNKKIEELKESIFNQNGASKALMTSIIDCLLGLTECNVSLLSEIVKEKELLTKLLEKSSDKTISDISFKLLMNQNELFKSYEKMFENKISSLEDKMNEVIKKVESNSIDNSIIRQPPKNSFFSHRKKEINNSLEKGIEENDEIDIISNDSVIQREDEEKKKKMKMYESAVRHIRYKPDKDIFGIFSLIRTGVFDDEQVKAIRRALDNRLTVIQILEFAHPDNSARTMNQLIDYLLALAKNNNVDLKTENNMQKEGKKNDEPEASITIKKDNSKSDIEIDEDDGGFVDE